VRRAAARAAAPIVGSSEIIIGIGLTSSLWLADAVSDVFSVAAAALFVCFVGVVGFAIRKGASCGCWSSFSDGPAGPVELGRSLLLAALSIALVVATIVSHSWHSWGWAGLAWATLCAAATFGYVVFGGRVFPGSADLHDRYKGGASGAQDGLAAAARLVSIVTGRVTSDLGRSPVPIERNLRAEESLRVISAALASPSVKAFCSWMGERASSINWSAAVAQTTTTVEAGRGSLTIADIRPTATTAMAVDVLMPLDGSAAGEAVVFARVDGVSVVVSDGVVTVQDRRS
jgi:hypothetical protein